MLVWFHCFPEASDVMADDELFSQVSVSVFQTASDKQCAKKLFSGSFNEFSDFIAKYASFDDAEIVLPAKDVLYTQVSVPSKSRKRILQALPFILEDNLIKDIGKQFFALGNVANGQCNIAIVSRDIIKKIYQQFKKLAIPVSRMTSELFQLPWYQGKWTVTFLQNEILIRTGEQSGLTFAANNIDFVFRLLLEKSNSSEAIKPEAVILYAQKESDLIEKIQLIAQEFDIDIEVKKGNLLKFALSEKKSSRKHRNASVSTGVNLLQGEYDPGNINKVKIPFLKSLAAVLAVWIVSQIVFMGYQGHLYKNELTAVETELEQLYFKTFPDSKRMIDVRAQTESKLQQLQKSSSYNDSFLSLLGLVGQELRQIKEVKIQNLRYIDGILQIDIRSKGFVFNKLKTILQDKHGLLVEEKSSSKVKDEVHTVINFRLKNS